MFYKNTKTGNTWDIVDADTLKMVEKDSDFERIENGGASSDDDGGKSTEPPKGDEGDDGKDVNSDASASKAKNKA